MSSLNTVTISGNLARDPDVKILPSGMTVTEFTVAVSDWYKPKDGDGQEKTYWIRAKAFGNTAKRIGDMFHKGKPIAVEGKLVQEEWDDKDGKKQSKTLVLVNDFVFMGSKTERPAQSDAPAQTTRKPAVDPDLDSDDGQDIPF